MSEGKEKSMYSVVKEQMMYNKLQKAAERARQLDRSLLEQPAQGNVVYRNMFSGTTRSR